MPNSSLDISLKMVARRGFDRLDRHNGPAEAMWATVDTPKLDAPAFVPVDQRRDGEKPDDTNGSNDSDQDESGHRSIVSADRETGSRPSFVVPPWP